IFVHESSRSPCPTEHERHPEGHRTSISSYGGITPETIPDLQRQEEREDALGAHRPLGWGNRLYYCVLSVVASSVLVVFCGIFRASSGEVSLESDANFPFATTTKHPLRPGPLWGTVKRPFPTGAWWLNLVIGDGDYPVTPFPYTITARDDGIGISYSAMRRVVTLKRVQDAYATDLSVSTIEEVTRHQISKYDNLTVTIQHDTDGGGHFCTLVARGSPYMTFEFSGTTPTIKSNGDILEMDGEKAKPGSSVHGTTFKLSLSNWETWMIFTSDSVSLKMTSRRQVQIQEPFSGIVRVAVLPQPWDAESEETLMKHAYAYPRGGNVAFNVDGDGDRVEMRRALYEWIKDGFGDLLMMALPHHLDMMQDLGENVPTVMEGIYFTIKGPMAGIVGSVWTMHDNLTDIAWIARTPLDKATAAVDDPLLSLSWKRQIKKALAEDLRTVLPTAPDVYGFGKQIARFARLVLIADELGDVDSRDAALATLSAYLTPWMKNENQDILVYDKTWGGVVTRDGLNDENADFGNAWYNDHTYHYGYLLYAAAVLVKFRPAFYEAYKEQLDFLVGDVAGQSTGDKAELFPNTRQKDFYDGHSWTSGLFPQGNGKSQESVSESINAYFAVYLLGLATGDNRTRDWGRVLLALELRAARKYWQMPDGNGVYDSFFSSHRMVGVVASLEAVQLTWFGGNVEYVHCINMLPFTPITEELLQRDFVEQEWPVLETAFVNRTPAPQWAGFIALAAAVVMPLEAWVNITETDVFDSGNSKTNSLYWIATRPQTATEAYNESAFAVEVKIDPRCEENSACRARALIQEKVCCPTKDGTWLGCCPVEDGIHEAGPSACAANPECVALSLQTGLCCPTVSGEMLACCERAQESQQQQPDTEIDSQARCSSNAGCTALRGACCPTSEGVYLGCCGLVPALGNYSGNASSTDQEPGGKQACAAHARCSSLEGDCCPSPGGVYLECCDMEQHIASHSDVSQGHENSTGSRAGGDEVQGESDRACVNHAGCSSLLGDCCPTSDGVHLGCCDGDRN
ncbi:unnamed protein product, partial [Ascophyllum nodosum]